MEHGVDRLQVDDSSTILFTNPVTWHLADDLLCCKYVGKHALSLGSLILPQIMLLSHPLLHFSIPKAFQMQINALSTRAFMDSSFITQTDHAPPHIILQTLWTT